MIKECTLCWEQKEIPEFTYYSCCLDCEAKLHWNFVPMPGHFASDERRAEKKLANTIVLDCHCKGCTCESR